MLQLNCRQIWHSLEELECHWLCTIPTHMVPFILLVVAIVVVVVFSFSCDHIMSFLIGKKQLEIKRFEQRIFFHIKWKVLFTK